MLMDVTQEKLTLLSPLITMSLSLVHIRRGATGRDVRIDGKRRDGLTASNVNTGNGNATVLPYRSGSDGKSWIDPTFHTVDGRRRGRKRTKRLQFECEQETASCADYSRFVLGNF